MALQVTPLSEQPLCFQTSLREPVSRLVARLVPKSEHLDLDTAGPSASYTARIDRTLCEPPAPTPVRGQHVVVANPGIDHFFMEGPPGAAEWASYVPHGEHVVLGGIAQPGAWDTQPDPTIAERIRERCVAVEPRLAEAEVVEHRVGLRPQRDVVRVEEETVDGARCIHNYGHGGLGVTLSWGCAREVADLLRFREDSAVVART